MIVVVLNQTEAVPPGDVQQLEPPTRTHRHRRGVLMMRGDVDRAQCRLSLGQPGEMIDIEAARIDRHADHARTGRAKGRPGERIAGSLDRDRLSRFDDRGGGQKQTHLTAARHHQVAGRCRQPAFAR